MLAGREPPIADVCWVVASPVPRVLQYLSIVMAGRARRLVLLSLQAVSVVPWVGVYKARVTCKATTGNRDRRSVGDQSDVALS